MNCIFEEQKGGQRSWSREEEVERKWGGGVRVEQQRNSVRSQSWQVTLNMVLQVTVRTLASTCAQNNQESNYSACQILKASFLSVS